MKEEKRVLVLDRYEYGIILKIIMIEEQRC